MPYFRISKGAWVSHSKYERSEGEQQRTDASECGEAEKKV